MKSIFLSTSAILLALAVTGCATEPPQALKPTYVPSNFTAPVSAEAPLWPQADWWKGFDSEELNGMIATAQADNLDLANALGVVLQAEGNAEAAGAPLFPQIGLDAGATHSRVGAASSAFGKSVTGNAFNLGVSGTWA